MLSDKRIRELRENYSPTQGIESFARAIEAEVRKQDTELIRQMLVAFKTDRLEIEDWPESSRAAIAAARKRLEGA